MHHMTGIIVFGGLLGPLFLMIGLQTANSMSVSIWLNMELVATAVLGMIIFKDHLGKLGVIGVLLTLAASIIITSSERGSGIISGLFVVAACFCWGIDNHLTAIVDGVTPQTTTFIKGLFGGTVNLLIGMFLNNWSIRIEYLGIALVIGVISYGISIFLYVTAAQNLGATRSQVLFSTAPFWGILAAFIFLGEQIYFSTFAAGLILIAGIIFSNLSSHNHKHLHKAVTHIHMHSHDDLHHHHEHDDGSQSQKKHSHIHSHEETEHSHEHFSDMHHRHKHT